MDLKKTVDETKKLAEDAIKEAKEAKEIAKKAAEQKTPEVKPDDKKDSKELVKEDDRHHIKPYRKVRRPKYDSSEEDAKQLEEEADRADYKLKEIRRRGRK